MLRGPSLFGALVALALAGTAPVSTAPEETAESAAAPKYVAQILPMLPGQLGAYARDINSDDVACGWGVNADRTTSALIWRDGEVRDISGDLPGWRLREALGINDKG